MVIIFGVEGDDHQKNKLEFSNSVNKTHKNFKTLFVRRVRDMNILARHPARMSGFFAVLMSRIERVSSVKWKQFFKK